ncbi:ABC-F family ATP-binding cassette domain-containing protein [Stomatobaculum longum]|uniref:ABC-F family ATP-binding cassette domain-containing protein n=1 Tax=Stomatobaculum longum TaxID=796942 RepID=UPI0028ED91C0|nr:ABC-F family ATP-binding cassette domain-containing protein [Stomatobaculum longum]
MNTIVSIEHLEKVYTARKLFDDTACYIGEGEKLALIGVNGTGKSTLLRIVAGEESPDSGELIVRKGLQIRFLSQNPKFCEEETALSACLRMAGGEALGEDTVAAAKKLLAALGVTELDLPCETLSGGEKKRIALAGVLLYPADLLILDEPTNHLDGETAEWLENYLKNFGGALLMVTHDRYFLDSVCTRILELDRGKIYSYDANYEGFLALKAERLDIQQANERTRQSILRKELAWMQRGARARGTKSKERIARYEKLSAESGPEAEASLQLASAYSRLGKTTLAFQNVSKGFDGKTLFRDFSYQFQKNDRLGIIGRNGAGKSTLLKLITGLEKPDSGEIEIGQTVKIGYFSQENEALSGDLTVIESIKEIAEFVPSPEGPISAAKMLERFLFPSSQHYMKVEKLSGGEKRRLFLLKILMGAPNLLILDEPTNDLDIRTMTVLEDYLDSFAGIVIAVSHDRYFLDRTVHRILALEDGVISQYEGGYTDYQVEKLRRELLRGENAGSGAESTVSAEKEASKQRAEETRRQRARRMSYQEKQDFLHIEDEIAALEARVAEIESEYAASASDFQRLTALDKEREEVETKLLERMERWEFLTELQAEIESEKETKL